VKKLLPVIFASLLVVGVARGQGEKGGILHLELTLVRGVFSLIDFTIDSGTVRVPEPEPPTAGRIRYVVMDHSGRPMSEGMMLDPARVRRESAKKGDSLKTPTEDLDSVDVHLTLPYDRALHRIHFAKIIGVSDTLGVRMTHTADMGSVYIELHGEDE
jgi:hypothetical protein